ILKSSSFSALAIEDALLRPEEQPKNIVIHPLPKDRKDVAELISSILSMAHGEISGIGGFLYLYQIAEHLMELHFAELVQSALRQSLPAWKLKKKLTEATSESARLRQIARRASDNGANMLVFDSLGTACNDLLKSCDAERDADSNTWIDSMYGVRNLLVHNHLSIIRSNSSSKLEQINSLLHRAMLEMIFKY
ncbi:hypothetical protein ACOI1H_18750, partial [Loktanella sp. DJP18]|uniref:hypothetical protein n=1 Tax=Loktanella sp. DJP18 TaxID=3409788 RepID=UPI003BB731C8